MARIELVHVTKRFDDGTTAVDDVTFSVEDGELFVLVGPSGSGKSTVLNLIVGLEAVTSGTIKVDGKVINDIDPQDRGMAVVFQGQALYPHMTVRQNLAFPLKVARVPARERARRVDEVAELLALAEVLDRRPATLSGGQRQRVAMGRAVIRRPRVYLMDEPLSSVDAEVRVSMRALLAELQDRLGVTTVYVTHDQTEAMTLGDRVAVLREGRLEQVGTPRELYRNPIHLGVATTLGTPAINLLPSEVAGGEVHTPLGSLPLPEAWRDRVPSSTGSVVIGIRPEHFAPGPGPAGAVSVSVKADLIEWSGPDAFVYFSVDAPVGSEPSPTESGDLDGGRQRLCARVGAAGDLRSGQEVTLWIDAAELLVFDAATGRSLLAGPAPVPAAIDLREPEFGSEVEVESDVRFPTG